MDQALAWPWRKREGLETQDPEGQNLAQTPKQPRQFFYIPRTLTNSPQKPGTGPAPRVHAGEGARGNRYPQRCVRVTRGRVSVLGWECCDRKSLLTPKQKACLVDRGLSPPHDTHTHTRPEKAATESVRHELRIWPRVRVRPRLRRRGRERGSRQARAVRLFSGDGGASSATQHSKSARVWNQVHRLCCSGF